MTSQVAGGEERETAAGAVSCPGRNAPSRSRGWAVADPARLRDALMIALAAVAGATDATAFARLGHVFTSVMTGNLVLLGISVGQGSLSGLGHTVLAVSMFIAGTMAGAHISGVPRDDDVVWPRRLSTALAVELIIFVGVAVTWWASDSQPAGGAQAAELGACALALGIQSSAVLRLNVSGLSTTYMTGTLTALVRMLTTTRRLKGGGRSASLLLALVAGAALVALLVVWLPSAVPLVPLVILAAVLLGAEFKLLR